MTNHLKATKIRAKKRKGATMFHQETSYTLKQLANLLHAEIVGDADFVISGVGDICDAKNNQIIFLDNEKYSKFLKTSQAGACIISRGQAAKYADFQKNFLIVSEPPSSAFQKCLELFIPAVSSGFSGIHPLAFVHPTAEIGKGVSGGR